MAQDKNKQATSSKRRHEHAQEVRRQVKVKEGEKIATRRAFFEEGIKLDQEAKERSVALHCTAYAGWLHKHLCLSYIAKL